ncbi:rod shape-determining protein RodA [Patescibacteria group bacterium]|nr:rod shape-determining protein RodA [Patescibacteria group bacterium]
MFKSVKIWFKKVDWLLMLNVFFLLLFSLTALYSLNINQPLDSTNLFVRQLVFVLIGLILVVLFTLFDYRWLKNYHKLILAIVFLLLLVVNLFAEPIRGMTGWLAIGGQSFQPSEFAKLAIVFFLASYFTRWQHEFYKLKHILITGGITALFAGLVATQPDFGSAVIIFATWFIMLWFVKIPKKYFLYLIIVFVIISIILWSFVFVDYQKARLISFISPTSDVLGEGYNVNQSMIAIGSGQLLGRGLGLGPQSQLNFLPEQYSDFIFAVIAESFGLWGSIALLLLFALLYMRFISIVKNSGNAFASWMVLGFTIYLSLQTFVNIAMTIGIAPVTGITLPFVSYGGSSLLTTFIVLGIVQNVIMTRRGKLFTH